MSSAAATARTEAAAAAAEDWTADDGRDDDSALLPLPFVEHVAACRLLFCASLFRLIILIVFSCSNLAALHNFERPINLHPRARSTYFHYNYYYYFHFFLHLLFVQYV